MASSKSRLKRNFGRKRQTWRKSDAAPTRASFAPLAGILLVVASTLMLTFTPQSVYQWIHRLGYIRTQAEFVSRQRRYVTVRVASTGDRLTIKSTTFDSLSAQAPAPAWYNREARLVRGIVLFDERLVSAERHPVMPSGAEVFIEVSLNAAFILAAYLLLRRP